MLNAYGWRKNDMTWQDFEKHVRKIASFRWGRRAGSKTVADVKCDCVLELSKDHWVAVEITQEKNLNKIREDIAKLFMVRNTLFKQNIYCECFIVMESVPTNSMRGSGEMQNVRVVSAEEFRDEFFDYSNYVYIRKQRQFGSLINIDTGEPENNIYINVPYRQKSTGKNFSVDDIISLLKKGKRVVLKGDFGLGKSRCVKQIFDKLTTDTKSGLYAIAINLRDHWGSKRATEILSRHFYELGQSEANFLKIYDKPNAIYLLDGFDEIGTQSWNSDMQKMRRIREASMYGLKDLIEKVRGGVLITGREYYFNSDEELMSSLGLSAEQTVFLECYQEFTDLELLAFIQKNIPESIKSEDFGELPPWLPKRPLVIQLLLRYASEIFSVKNVFDDICSFWYIFLTKLCEREAKIHVALNPETIRRVLMNLANQTRMSKDNTGPITQNDLSSAFVEAAGFTPNDETAIMLQRLPSLGRISADSPDRQFLDSFILNGLRAESIIQLSESWDTKIFSADWKYPLDQTGLSILAEYIGMDAKRIEPFLTAARSASLAKNQVLAADIVSALCLLDVNSIDFKGIYICGGYFSHLSFEGKEIKRLEISDSIIEKVDLTNSKLDNSVKLCKCIISAAHGVASRNGIPSQFVDCEVTQFEQLATTTLIKRARLSEPQKLFVEMIRKIFFQPGAGRKESALLRGMGMSANKRLGGKILDKLKDEGLIIQHKGDEGPVYKPVRKETGRVNKILTDLTLSEDPLWQYISTLS